MSSRLSLLQSCHLCPRACHQDRTLFRGVCQANAQLMVARAALHPWEEPCISGSKGSGTIFFSGCPMQCIFCQNHEISHKISGIAITSSRLAEIMLHLQDLGAHNINLVTGTPYVCHILDALDLVKGKLHIPVAYNSSGYESLETIRMLKGYVDIYMPDFKYWDDELAKKYSHINNYREIAQNCIQEMFAQTGAYRFSEDLLASGVLVRHLVLPSARKDSEHILNWISETFGKDVLVSLMSQYTPPQEKLPYNALNRRVTSFEYERVVNYASDLDLIGFMQERSSANSVYTPAFRGEGVLDF